MGAPFSSLLSPAVPQEGATETFLPPHPPMTWLCSKTAPSTPSGPSGVRPRPLTHGSHLVAYHAGLLAGFRQGFAFPRTRVPSFADLS